MCFELFQFMNKLLSNVTLMENVMRSRGGVKENSQGRESMSLLQGIVGWHYLLSFRKGCSSVSYGRGDRTVSNCLTLIL